MRRSALLVVPCAVAAAAVVHAQMGAAPAHPVVAVPDMVWVDGPPALPPGQKVAVLAGDPRQPGPYVLRAQIPAGYRIPPHWHPTEENLTVLSGTFAVGMGETFDEKTLHDMTSGSYALMPSQMRHYALARTPVVLQVHGVGPFTLTYVNPQDDPRLQPKKP